MLGSTTPWCLLAFEPRQTISSLRILSVAILTVILEFLPGLKANGLSRRDGHFFAGAGIATDAAFAWLDDENAKAPQLDPIAARKGVLHRIEERLDCLFGFQLRDAGLVGKAIDDIEFDHGNVASGSGEHSLVFSVWKARFDLCVAMIERRANNCQGFTG